MDIADCIFTRVHLVHHKSTDLLPFAALAFHPFGAVLEAGILPMAVTLWHGQYQLH